MTTHYPLTRQLLLHAGALLTSACLSVDDRFLRDPEKDAGEALVCPDGYICTPADQVDRDGGKVLPDAKIWEPMPIEPPLDPDADDRPDGAVAIQCNEEAHCGADTFCSVSGLCTPRCTPERGCLVPNTGRLNVTSLLRTAEGVLYATEPRDGPDPHYAPDRHYDGEIWLLKEDGSTSKLVSGLDYARLKLVADGQIYLEHLAAREDGSVLGIHQAALSGGSPQPVQVGGTPVKSVVASAGYLWWAHATTLADDIPSFALWRRARSPGAQDEKVKDIRGQALLAATDRSVYYSYWQGSETRPAKSDLMVDELTGAAPRLISRVESFWYEATLLEERIVGLAAWEPSVRGLSIPLSGSGPTLEIVPPPLDVKWTNSANLINYDGLLYWGERYTTSDLHVRMRFGRSDATLASEPEVVTDFEESQTAYFSSHVPGLYALAPWPAEIVYYSASEQRLFRLPIPGQRCSASVACPSGRTCQPDHTCR